MTMENYLLEFSRFHCFGDGYNVLILSRLFTEVPDMWEMLSLFPLIVWLLIFISTLCITFLPIIGHYIKGMSDAG